MNTRLTVFAIVVLSIIGGGAVHFFDKAFFSREKPAGFHVACFDINGHPYINAVGPEWSGDVDGVIRLTMDGGKAFVHGERCLVEEMTPQQWAEVHRPTAPAPAPTPVPTPSSTPSTPSEVLRAAKSYGGEFDEHVKPGPKK